MMLSVQNEMAPLQLSSQGAEHSSFHAANFHLVASFQAARVQSTADSVQPKSICCHQSRQPDTRAAACRRGSLSSCVRSRRMWAPCSSPCCICNNSLRRSQPLSARHDPLVNAACSCWQQIQCMGVSPAAHWMTHMRCHRPLARREPLSEWYLRMLATDLMHGVFSCCLRGTSSDAKEG